jgi:ABC-type transport system involved in multi-copper enzyme maturation permease subunit
VLRFDPTPFDVWQGLGRWALVLGAFLLVALIVSYVVAVATVGFKRSLGEFAMHLRQGLRELVLLSPRRIFAITQLTLRESIRRKALLVFVVFALLFMFGSWFISDPGERPEMQATVHITFILKAIAWLSVPVVLLLACWGLPQDIKQRSLHTVVTKPVRRSEVVIGRILGFAAMGTLILGVMAVAGHVWIKRQVPDEAQSLLVSRVPVYGSLEFTDDNGQPGKGVNVGDIWEFRSYINGATAASAIWTFEDITPERLVEQRDPDGNIVTDPKTGEPIQVLRLEYNFEAFRTHKGTMGRGVQAQFMFINDLRTQMSQVFSGLPEYQIVADKIAEGNFSDAGDELKRLATGIDPGGVEVEKADRDAFVTRLQNLSELMEPFTAKGTLPAAGEFVAAANAAQDAAEDENDKALAAQFNVLGQLIEDHAETLAQVIVNVHAQSRLFEVIEYKRTLAESDEQTTGQRREEATTTYEISRTLTNASPIEGEGARKAQLDLFEDLTHGGRFRVQVYCRDSGQYIGMARPDLYIRNPDRSFESGYYKAVGGIWLMLLLIVVLSVTASTFVKGPVATLLTATLIVIGLSFNSFLDELVTKLGSEGYGTLESIVRIVEHKNPTTSLEDRTGYQIMKIIDRVINRMLATVAQTIPNFNVFSLTPYVANGFDVPFDAGLLPALATTLAYIIPCLFIGYFSLRLRELEAK